MANNLKIENIRKKSKYRGIKNYLLFLILITIIVFGINSYGILQSEKTLNTYSNTEVEIKDSKIIYMKEKDNSIKINDKTFTIYEKYGSKESLKAFQNNKEAILFSKTGILVRGNLPLSNKSTINLITSKKLKDGNYTIGEIYKEKRIKSYITANYVGGLSLSTIIVSYCIYFVLFAILFFITSISLTAKLYVNNLNSTKIDKDLSKLLYKNGKSTGEIFEEDNLIVRFSLTDLFSTTKYNIHYSMIILIYIILGQLFGLNLLIDEITIVSVVYLMTMYVFIYILIRINHKEFIKDLYLNKVEIEDLIKHKEHYEEKLK